MLNDLVLLGLTEDMIESIQGDPDLEEMLKLHRLVQKIKKRHFEVKTQVGELKTMYDDLGTRMADVSKAQSTTNKTVSNDKKDDDGKGKGRK